PHVAVHFDLPVTGSQFSAALNACQPPHVQAPARSRHLNPRRGKSVENVLSPRRHPVTVKAVVQVDAGDPVAVEDEPQTDAGLRRARLAVRAPGARVRRGSGAAGRRQRHLLAGAANPAVALNHLARNAAAVTMRSHPAAAGTEPRVAPVHDRHRTGATLTLRGHTPDSSARCNGYLVFELRKYAELPNPRCHSERSPQAPNSSQPVQDLRR